MVEQTFRIRARERKLAAAASAAVRRICFVNPSGQIGGAERALLLLLRHLDLSRYAPSVVCLGDGPMVGAVEELRIPVRVVEIGIGERLSRSGGSGKTELLRGAAALAKAGLQAARVMRQLRPDLVHTNGMKAHLVGGSAARLLRLPLVWHMRDLMQEGKMRRAVGSLGGFLPHRILGVSSVVTEQFGPGRAASRRTRTVYDAVDVPAYTPRRAPEEIRRELGLDPSVPVAAMVAHFTRWKGHLVFLEALALLAEEGVEVQGLIIGGSIYYNAAEREYEAEVRAAVSRLGLQDRVRFTGFQYHVPDYLNAADLLIHPPTRPEPFGLAVVEAMALEKPVVASAAGGPLETVEPEVTGRLATPGCPRSFADATRSLLADPELRQVMGRRGRERVQRLFAPETHFDRIDAVYRELLAA